MTLTFLSNETLEDILARSHESPIILFKHSNACGTSERMLKKTEEYTPDIDTFVVTVQTHRELSDEIEEHFGIHHESPQAIVLYHGDPLYYDNHTSIDPEKIARVANEARELL